MNSAFYIVPFFMSAAFFCLDIVLAVYWYVKPKKLKKKKVFSVTRNTGKHLMFFSMGILISVWLLRFAIGNWCFEHPDPLGEIPVMGWRRQIFNSFLHSLQTFSMDEVYTAYMENGIKMAMSVLNGHFRYASALYISALNVIAPIAGGAFIFEILAGIFPQLLFVFSKCAWYKTRFYFTALNDQSLSLAKSIVSDSAFKHVLLIFTDVYSDDENEESSEMLLSAKALGAICLKDDLLHISLKKIGKKRTYIFLSDQEETENLKTLAQLLNPEKQKELNNTEIRVFGTDKKTSYIEDEVIYLHNRLSAEYEDKNLTIGPDIAPFNGIRNMSQNLFHDIPLFEGLYGKDGNSRQLNLTIIGSGAIGTEIFLNAYWFGQMVGVEFNINVVSANEEENEFVSRIDGINPDIMATSKNGNEILNANIGEDKSETKPVSQPRYFRFRYQKQNIVSCDLKSFLKTGIGEDGFCLRDTDYFVIAAGSDEEDFLIADKLRQAIGYYHLNEARQRKTIISYVIYNSDLCRTMNAKARQNHIHDSETDEFDIYMHAFGCMDEIYSVSNILRKDLEYKSESVDKKYNQRSSEKKDKPKTIFDQIRIRQYYNTRSNDARALQLRYKAYCANIIEPTLFKTDSDEKYRQLIADAENKFAHAVTTIWKYPEYASLANALAWMEHRRWNAFMRINGFKRPDDIDKYIKLDSDIHSMKPNHDKSYQFLFIKLHPCIVECDINGYPGVYCKDDNKREKGFTDVGPDELDLLFKKLGTDYKVYDYPDVDVK